MANSQLRVSITIAVALSALAACGGGSKSVSAIGSTTTTRAPYVATADGFKAVFPATPKKETHGKEQEGFSIKVTLYSATTNDEEVAVGVNTLPVEPDPAEISGMLDNSVDASAKNIDGTVTTRTHTTAVGVPAEDATISGKGVFLRERVFAVGRKLYIIEGATHSESASHADYDTLIATFALL
jgi:hypothetical protein